MSEISRTKYEDQRSLKLIRGLGAAVLCIGIGGGYLANEHSNENKHINTEQSVAVGDIPRSFDTQTQATPIIGEVEKYSLQPDVPSSHIDAVDLFGDGQNKVNVYSAPVDKNGFINFTPPERDGIYLARVTYADPNLPKVYHFGDTLSTDSKGNVIGDLLIQGHTNSGRNWIMNQANSLKVGDTQLLYFGNAEYITKITKITAIEKTGSNDSWPGFSEALGPNGAIETCMLSVDANGRVVQSGKIIVAAIEVIDIKPLA